MKTEFTPDYIKENKGCYDLEQVVKLPFIESKQEIVSIKDLFEGLPIKDFTWFLAKKCDLTYNQKVSLAIYCAEYVLPIYQKKYPNDFRVAECIKATKDFQEGNCTREFLLEKRAAAYTAADAAAAADAAHAAYACTAAADAAADAYAAHAAYSASASAAAYACTAAAAYSNHIWKFVESILNS